MDNPLISIVIPTYNHAALLKEALQSVLAQTYSNWEALVIDNCSSDNTVEVISAISDPRVTYVKIQNDGVIAKSRNLGIRRARGSWVAFLDSDDIWYPTRLSKVLYFINRNYAVDVWCTNEILLNLNKAYQSRIKYGPNSSDMYQRLLKYGNCLSPSATVVKKSFLEKNNLQMREDVNFITAEDYDFWLLLAKSGAKFNFLNSYEGQYTLHSANNSTQIERHETSIRNVLFDHVFNIQNFENKNKLWKKIEIRLLTEGSLRKITSRNIFSGMRGLLSAISSSPCYFVNLMIYFFYSKIK
jgi:glycosyltransferase involved in cell wall biosynthesis